MERVENQNDTKRKKKDLLDIINKVGKGSLETL